jgi:hypothetical protein
MSGRTLFLAVAAATAFAMALPDAAWAERGRSRGEERHARHHDVNRDDARHHGHGHRARHHDVSWDDARHRGHRHRARHHGHGHRARHHGHYDHARHGPGPGWKARTRAPRYARGVHVHHRHASYYCRPCERRFSDRSRLRHHVHRHHRVPFWRLSFSIVPHGFSWIFHG